MAISRIGCFARRFTMRIGTSSRGLARRASLRSRSSSAGCGLLTLLAGGIQSLPDAPGRHPHADSGRRTSPSNRELPTAASQPQSQKRSSLAPRRARPRHGRRPGVTGKSTEQEDARQRTISQQRKRHARKSNLAGEGRSSLTRKRHPNGGDSPCQLSAAPRGVGPDGHQWTRIEEASEGRIVSSENSMKAGLLIVCPARDHDRAHDSSIWVIRAEMI